MALRIERFWPAALALLAFLLNPWRLGWWALRTDLELQTIFGAAVGLAAIFAGFLATARSILSSYEKDRPVQVLKTVRNRGVTYYTIVLRYLDSAVRWSFVLAVVSLAFMLAPSSTDDPAFRWWFSGWLAVLVWALAACYRFLRLMPLLTSSPA